MQQKGCPKSWRRNRAHKSGQLGTFLWQLLQWFPLRFFIFELFHAIATMYLERACNSSNPYHVSRFDSTEKILSLKPFNISSHNQNQQIGRCITLMKWRMHGFWYAKRMYFHKWHPSLLIYTGNIKYMYVLRNR